MNDKTAIIVGNKIQICFDYNMDLINIVRDIEGRTWNGVHRAWEVPLTSWHCNKVIETLRPLSFFIDPEIISKADGKDKPDVKVKLPGELYGFQKEGVRFILSTGGRCIVADDMGLGKTIEALTYAKLFDYRTLVIAPSNVTYKWKNECERWFKTAVVIKDGKSKIEDAKVRIISYGLLAAKYEELSEMPFDLVIFDEAHYIKNHKSQRTRIAKALVKGGIQKVLFLSGTPFMNHPSELFPMLNMLDPIGFNNYYTYAIRYCGAEKHENGWFFPPDGSSNLDELAQRLGHIMVRRTKGDVLQELPDLTRTLVPVELDNKTEYKAALKDIRSWLETKDREVLNPQHVLTRLNTLRQVVGEGKVKAAIELAKNVLASDKQVVLFAHHKEIITSLAKELVEHGVLIISGDTPAKERDENSKLFLRENSQYRVMLISTAGAEGIDLYSSSDIIFVEREWTPAKEEQAEARLHRIGQKNAVNAYYLAADGTVDEKLAKIIERKRTMIGKVVSQDEIVTELIKEI